MKIVSLKCFVRSMYTSMHVKLLELKSPQKIKSIKLKLKGRVNNFSTTFDIFVTIV